MFDPNILRFTWKFSRKAQIWVLIVVLASLPTYFLSLDLPKRIVNGPILGQGFEQAGATDRFFRWEFTVGGEPWVLFEGFELDRLAMLFALSGAFLSLIIINGLFKFYINTYKGRLGERMLRRVRYALVDRLLRFPAKQFKRVKSSEVASMVKDEVEPLGGFMGDAFVMPLFLGGQALTAMAFIMVQNVWLGLIAISMIGVQFIIIPRLRRHLIRLGKERQITARQLAGRVGEVVDGIAHVHVNDTSNYERADLSSRLARIFYIRYELFQRKFFTKFLNNLLAQMTPFLFYVIGGYFALQGRLDVGQLVAVIAAYKDLPSPIKELIDWDQRRLDVQVKFAQVVEQFEVDDVLDAKLQAVPGEPVPHLDYPIKINNVTVVDDTGNVLLQRAKLDLKKGVSIAFVGPSNSGADVLADTLVRLYLPEGGTVSFGDDDLLDMPESVLGRRIGYSSSDVYLAQGTMRDALIYALKNQPVGEADYDGEARKQRERDLMEARLTGNTELDIRANWTVAPVEPGEEPRPLDMHVSEILKVVQLSDDVFNLGLRGVVNPEENPQFASDLLAAREKLRERMAELEIEDLVEVFDPNSYSDQATIAENLLFGKPVGGTFQQHNLMDNDYLTSILADTGLDKVLYEKGLELAETTIGLFQDLPPDHPFFEQLTFMDGGDIPDFQHILKRAKQGELSADERNRIITLPLSYIEPQHRMGLVDDTFRDMVVDARKRFQTDLPDELTETISFYDPETYNPAASVQDNLLMGRITYGMARGPQRVREAMSQLLSEQGLDQAVMNVGLDYDIGSAGKRLSAVQRQKIGLARALLKRPDLVILNRPLNALDSRQQSAAVKSVLDYLDGHSRKPAVVWVVSTAELSSHFDRVCVFDSGKIVENGEREKLLKSNGAYAKLVAA